jgi:hypothetical protein
MWQKLMLAVALIGIVSGCQQLPPPAGDAAAKRFESVADKSVIYVVRDAPDFSGALIAAPINLDDMMMGATYPGTYFRWEVPAGRHRITGYASDPGHIEINTAPGQVYFVQQQVAGNVRFRQSFFRVVSPEFGRAVAMRGELVAAQ